MKLSNGNEEHKNKAEVPDFKREFETYFIARRKKGKMLFYIPGTDLNANLGLLLNV